MLRIMVRDGSREDFLSLVSIFFGGNYGLVALPRARRPNDWWTVRAHRSGRWRANRTVSDRRRDGPVRRSGS
jgi:hypothetical protein